MGQKPLAARVGPAALALALLVLASAFIAAPVRSAFAAESPVEVSADGSAARLDGCAFALDGFSRANAGSNRPIDGAYYGYTYYVAASPGALAAIASAQSVVVYVPAQAARDAGLDLGSAADTQALEDQLITLDATASKGGAQLSASMAWHFTQDSSYTLDGLTYSFDRQLRTGEFYACVESADGGDATSGASPLSPGLTHAVFARIAPAGAVVVTAAPVGFAAFTSFLSSIDLSPLWVTLKTTGTAIVIIFALGLAAAYFSLRIPARIQDIADSVFTVPMVLPPTVCGFLLLLLFGRNTGIGRWFISIGFPLIFSWQATVLAAVVVAFPLMYRSARGAFEGLDANMLDAARTLGWSQARIFFRLMLPLAWSSIAAGTVLAFARALGEFGATLFLAGNYLGITRTVPIAIYFEWMNGKSEVAIFWTVVIIAVSFVVILFINMWGRRTTKYKRPVKEPSGTRRRLTGRRPLEGSALPQGALAAEGRTSQGEQL